MDIKEVARRIIGLLPSESREQIGVLVTCNGKGRPHATYMGTVASAGYNRLLAMTAPDSRKICNILENPKVEWLFLDHTKEELVYVWGTARVIQDPAEVEKAWAQLPDKSRAYFLSYETVGMKFLIFETKIDTFEYRVPRRHEVYRMAARDIVELVA